MRIAIVILLGACAGAPEDPQRECGSARIQIRLPSHADQVVDCDHCIAPIHVPDAFAAGALEPLRDMERIDGSFSIFRNHAIEDLHDLANLELIGGRFAITFDEGKLGDLDGLESLREVGELMIHNNSGLENLRGLRGLVAVHGDVTFRGNPRLPQSEIDWLLARIDVQGAILVEP